MVGVSKVHGGVVPSDRWERSGGIRTPPSGLAAAPATAKEMQTGSDRPPRTIRIFLPALIPMHDRLDDSTAAISTALPPAAAGFATLRIEPVADPRATTSAGFVEVARLRGRRGPEPLEAYRRFHRVGDLAATAAVGLPAPPPPQLAATQIEGRTIKFTLRFEDGLESESVVIPMRRTSGEITRTLCVSSQVGCAMNCRFCETAQMGLLRNLSAAEIVAQWHAARFEVPAPEDEGRGHLIRNIVFMGMGEPTENLDEVLQAIRVLCDRNGPGLAASKIAVSTVGRIEGIRRLGAFMHEPGFRGLGLAVSVNAPNDEIRTRIMPINRAEPMDALREAMLAFPKRPSAALCIEYVLIPGVNDALEHCDEICAYLRPLRCSLNVIPYNPRRDSPWPAPEESVVDAFIARAIANGQFVKRRGTKGRSVMGACGQLGNPDLRRPRRTKGTAPRA